MMMVLQLFALSVVVGALGGIGLYNWDRWCEKKNNEVNN